eukprot:7857976-Lingulodinium_polyedra.AAC.1
MPRGATWDLLLHNCAVGCLRNAMLTHPHGDRISAVPWNARWLVDPQAAGTRNKKAEIEAALASGKP